MICTNLVGLCWVFMRQTLPPPHPPNSPLLCCAVKLFLENLVLSKLSEYIKFVQKYNNSLLMSVHEQTFSPTRGGWVGGGLIDVALLQTCTVSICPSNLKKKNIHLKQNYRKFHEMDKSIKEKNVFVTVWLMGGGGVGEVSKYAPE